MAHWMTTGSRGYPFATVGYRVGGRRHRLGWILPTVEEPDIRGARLIDELGVDRDSVRRALRDDPDSLQGILDELRNAWNARAKDRRAVRVGRRNALRIPSGELKAVEMRLREVPGFFPGPPVRGNRLFQVLGGCVQPAWFEAREVATDVFLRVHGAEVNVGRFPSHGRKQPEFVAVGGENT
jgi:hypothetical protein